MEQIVSKSIYLYPKVVKTIIELSKNVTELGSGIQFYV